MKVLVGKKIGMTQVFDEQTGVSTPVTVLDVSGNVIAKHLKKGETVTHFEIAKDKQKKPLKVDAGNYKTLNFVPRFKKSVKLTKDEQVSEVGTEVKADIFAKGDIVQVSGVTKGKGFQGGMKRHGFKGTKRTHGQSDRMRAPGSIGSGTTIGRVLKGTRMAGRMGRDNQTIKNLVVMDVDVENGLVSVSGSIPGNRNAYVLIKEIKRYKK